MLSQDRTVNAVVSQMARCPPSHCSISAGNLGGTQGDFAEIQELRRIAGIATLWVFMGSNCEQFTL
jgi:hypothetical protein